MVEKALKHYEELLEDPNMDEYIKDNKHPEYFPLSIAVVIKRLKEEIKDWTTGKDKQSYVYAPGFVDRDDEMRHALDLKYDSMVKKKVK